MLSFGKLRTWSPDGHTLVALPPPAKMLSTHELTVLHRPVKMAVREVGAARSCQEGGGQSYCSTGGRRNSMQLWRR